MRVAIPTKNGRIEGVFSKATEFTVYDVEIELVQTKRILKKADSADSGELLSLEGINTVICGRISSRDRNMLRLKRIELTYGVSGEADDVMIRYLSGERLGNIDENAYWSKEI